MPLRHSIVLAVGCVLIGCGPPNVGGPVPSPRMIVCVSDSCAQPGDIEVMYLGVGGFMIKAGGEVMLTAPHYTNPSPGEVGASAVRPNAKLIDSLLPPNARSATAILVGHGHYDHLLDVPYIAANLATEAKVYGGPSIRNMLWGERSIRRRLVAIDTIEAATVTKPGKPFTSDSGRFRFTAIRSNHAPAILTLFGLWRWDWAPGHVPDTMPALPRRAKDWKLGETYAYLIEVLDAQGKPRFRIYYQDTASDSPLGTPPGGDSVDLAILTVSSAQNARPRAPDALLEALNPRFVIASHWEYFFRNQTHEIKRNPPAKFKQFDASMRKAAPNAEWSVPRPGAVYRFRPAR